MPYYDYVIVGAGLTGATIARTLKWAGKRCLVIDRNSYVGGMCADDFVEEANCYRPKFGGHIFHTSNPEVYGLFTGATKAREYKHQVIAYDGSDVYALPFNMFTFNKLWGVVKAADARRLIESQLLPCEDPKNMEDLALSTIGPELYMRFVYGYTRKQWGMEPRDLPPAIIKRIPIRYDYNTCYFNRTMWQCMPKNGYSNAIRSMLDGIDVVLGMDHSGIRNSHLIYTGSIDEYFNYKEGKLPYRTSVWESTSDSYGAATTNFPKLDYPATRLIEFDRFYPDSRMTVAAYEYSVQHEPGMVPMYPIPTPEALAIYDAYTKQIPKNVTMAGRLGQYKYMDMDISIAAAIDVAHNLIGS